MQITTRKYLHVYVRVHCGASFVAMSFDRSRQRALDPTDLLRERFQTKHAPLHPSLHTSTLTFITSLFRPHYRAIHIAPESTSAGVSQNKSISTPAPGHSNPSTSPNLNSAHSSSATSRPGNEQQPSAKHTLRICHGTTARSRGRS